MVHYILENFYFSSIIKITNLKIKKNFIFYKIKIVFNSCTYSIEAILTLYHHSINI